MKAACSLENINTRPEVEVIGIAKYDLRPDFFFQVFDMQPFNCADSPDGLLDCARALAAGGERPVPHTYIEGRPCAGGRFAGIQAWAMAPPSMSTHWTASLKWLRIRATCSGL